MSRFLPLLADIYDAVAASPEASAVLGPEAEGWLAFGLPPEPGLLVDAPVVRIDGPYLDDDKLKRYPMTLKLWAFEDGDYLKFLDLAEALKDALNSNSKLLDSTAGYVPRNEPQLYCALFNVVAYLG